MADENEVLAPEAGNPAEVQTSEPVVPDGAPVDDVKPNAAPVAGDDGSLLSGAPDGDGEKVVPADWPEDWRDKLAKGDEKLSKRLARFQSPADILKSFQALEAKMSSGEVRSTLPENATEEQIAAYRKDNGIPEKPDGYLENLPNGLVIGEEDKPMVEGFLASLHAQNAPPAAVAASLDWYYEQQETIAAEQFTADKASRQAGEDDLRSEWGAEYRSNLNTINAFLDSAPALDGEVSFKDMLINARQPDGTIVGNNPAAMRWLMKLATDANPAGFIAPSAGTSQIEGVTQEIEKIENVMRTNRAAYDKDVKMQERLRTLYTAQEKLSA